MSETVAITKLEQIFPGNSEMARRMRAFDWTTTPLGPPATWPRTLRAAVSICLGSRHPIVIWWGHEAAVQFYNDAYISFLGDTKHPWLGRSGRECWKEIWDTMGPMWESVFATGEATWSEDFLYAVDRNPRREEAYFTFSYSPLWTESDSVGGIFCACSEVSRRIIGERRLATLRDLGAQPLNSRSVKEACEKAAAALAANPYDIAFAAIYQVSGDADAELYATTGVDNKNAFTDTFRPSLNAAQNLKSSQELSLAESGIKLPGGAWPENADRAVVLPLLSATKETVSGIAILGVSPRRPFDADYRSFIDLVANQIATAIANAHAYEEERLRSEALAALDRAKTAFFSNVSHEFRTPLTLLLGPLQEALHDARAERDPAWHDQLLLMHRNGLRLQKLVNTLLDFSRIEAGRIEANYEATDLPAYTAQLAGMFDSAITQAGVRLVVDCPPASEPAYVDRDMWEKVVSNLLSNAFKFTFEGEIVVSVSQKAGGFLFSVQDTGIGIPADEIPRVFERFHRVRHAQSRTHEGTGIGLSLVQELVRLHGGEIHLDSALGLGTTFTIDIPAGSAHLPPDRITTSSDLSSAAIGTNAYVEEALRWLPDDTPNAGQRSGVSDYSTESATSVPCHGARVLVADDNADMRDYLRQLLGRYWSVQTVADGNAALKFVREERPELVVTDVMMPGLDGFEFLRSVREDHRTKDMPVILLSARAGDEAAAQALAAGADAYLVKPFAAKELIAYVGGHLQLNRQRQQSVTALRASEEKFSAAFDQSPLALTITSLDDGRLVEINESFVRLTGYSRDEALDRTIDELQLWVEPQKRLEGLERLRAGENISSPGIRFRTKAGAIRTAIVGARLIEINGRSHALSSVADVTDLLRAEAIAASDLAAMTRLNEIGSTCARAEMSFSECLDLILATAVEFTGADKGDIQLFDPNSDTLTIAANHGFGESFLKFFATVRREDASPCGVALKSNERVIVDNISRSDVYSSEGRRLLRAEGIHSAQSTPLVGSGGNLLGVISTHYVQAFRPDDRQLRLLDLLAREAADFLQRIQAEESLRDRADQLAALNATLQDADRRKDEFLAMLGHELRNPLSAVRNAVAIASLDETHRARALEIARRQTDQLGRLIDDLLDVARVTQGRISLRKERVALADVLHRALESTQSFIADRGLSLESAIPTKPIEVDADPDRLEQVFVNLLTNAGKYTDAGGRIIVTVECDADIVRVRVRDTGIGISADLLPHIWDLFAQANRSLDRSQGGLGIGLTIARRLVELHGGHVEAHSEGLGMGSEFVVTLPAFPTHQAEASQPLTDKLAPHGVRVLLVEDNLDAAESMTMLLELLGHRVRSAADGLEALEVARANPPDVMLVDIGLPGIDGYEVARRVRRDPALKSAILVALTGYGRSEDKQNSMAAGFDYHLVKPIDPDALSALVSGLGHEVTASKSKMMH